MKKKPKESGTTDQRTKRSFPLYLIYAFILSFILFILSGEALFLYYSYHLPDYQPLKEQNLNASSIVYSEEDEVVGKFLLENRMPSLMNGSQASDPRLRRGRGR